MVEHICTNMMLNGEVIRIDGAVRFPSEVGQRRRAEARRPAGRTSANSRGCVRCAVWPASSKQHEVGVEHARRAARPTRSPTASCRRCLRRGTGPRRRRARTARLDDEREITSPRHLVGGALLGRPARRIPRSSGGASACSSSGPLHHLVVVGPPVGQRDRRLEHRQRRDAIGTQHRGHQRDHAAVAVTDDGGAPVRRSPSIASLRVVGQRGRRLVVARLAPAPPVVRHHGEVGTRARRPSPSKLSTESRRPCIEQHHWCCRRPACSTTCISGPPRPERDRLAGEVGECLRLHAVRGVAGVLDHHQLAVELVGEPLGRLDVPRRW